MHARFPTGALVKYVNKPGQADAVGANRTTINPTRRLPYNRKGQRFEVKNVHQCPGTCCENPAEATAKCDGCWHFELADNDSINLVGTIIEAFVALVVAVAAAAVVLMVVVVLFHDG